MHVFCLQSCWSFLVFLTAVATWHILQFFAVHYSLYKSQVTEAELQDHARVRSGPRGHDEEGLDWGGFSTNPFPWVHVHMLVVDHKLCHSNATIAQKHVDWASTSGLTSAPLFPQIGAYDVSTFFSQSNDELCFPFVSKLISFYEQFSGHKAFFL